MVSSIPPPLAPLLTGHVDEVEGRLAPGAAFVTWRALNIDGFLHQAQQVIGRGGGALLLYC